MHCRAATSSDLPLLAEMNFQLIRDEGHRNRMSQAELEERMARWLAGDYEAVIFEQNDEPVGYTLFKEEPDWLYVRQFFIHREHRRKGLGRAAVEWLRENAWANAPRIRLDVLVNNQAGRAFWRDLGFEDYCITMELDSAQ